MRAAPSTTEAAKIYTAECSRHWGMEGASNAGWDGVQKAIDDARGQADDLAKALTELLDASEDVNVAEPKLAAMRHYNAVREAAKLALARRGK